MAIEQDGKEIAASETVTEGDTSVSAELAPGTYTFLCTVPGHAEAGMERNADGPVAGACRRPRSLACEARHAPCVLDLLGLLAAELSPMAQKFHVTTFGCQMNVHDSERMQGMLDVARLRGGARA